MNEIGKYKIIRKIGTGGMATVYLVQDKLMQKYFAMKILHPQFIENEKIRQRFIQEARLQISLNHPNIIRCFDVDFKDEYYYILLEYVPGLSLSDILAERQRPFPLDVNIAIFIQVLAALDYAHRQNVVHRDIKPHNIIVANSSGDLKTTDTVKIGDFGIAKAFGEDSHTRTGSRLGTLQYMSPEQIVDSSKADYRSDIYGLGVTFYQLLTGKLPYRDTTNELSLMEAIVKERVAMPAHFKNSYPVWVSAVIEKATEKDPQKRFQSCKSFLQAIQNGLNQTPAPAPAPRPARKTPSRAAIPKPTIQSDDISEIKPKPKTSVYLPIGIITGLLLIVGILFGLREVLPTSAVMKNYSGQNINKALSDLYDQGVSDIQVIKQISYSQRSGQVVISAPQAGISLTQGIPVTLTVAYNPEETSKFARYFTQGASSFLKSKRIFIYRLLFFDTFNDKAKDWRSLDTNADNYTIKQITGHLFVEKIAGRGPLLIDYPGPSVKNFIMRSDVAKVKNTHSPQNGIYYMDNGNMVNLLIDLHLKKYFAGLLKYGNWSGQWETEKSIAEKYPNYLELVVYEGETYLFVNGKLKKTYSSASIIKKGRPGLMVNSLNMPVTFDNVVVCGIL